MSDTLREESLFKIVARFPSHCGNSAYNATHYYLAEGMKDAADVHNIRYIHSEIQLIERLGYCQFRNKP